MSTCSRRMRCRSRSSGPSNTAVETSYATGRHYRRPRATPRIPLTVMARVFSGIKPTGAVTLGNYLGALRHWVADQHEHDALYCVVDLHALTVAHDPVELRELTRELFLSLMAVGLDPDVCTLFVQSHVPEH